MEESETLNDETVEDVNGETSEPEDFLLSDTEDVPPSDENITLSIDYNGRITTQDTNCDNKMDDCYMHFAESGRIGHRSSEAGFHTSTEDLNVSDDEKSYNALKLRSINLDGIASTSKKDTDSLSSLNSHTTFKNECDTDAEYLSDDEISSNMEKKLVIEDKHKNVPSGFTVAGLSATVKAASPAVFPATRKALNTLNVKNIFTDSLLIDVDDTNDPDSESESPPMTCMEFFKSEISDGHMTDAEDISVGSLDDIVESSENRNPSGKVFNALNVPVSLIDFSSDNKNRNSYSGERRSSAGFNTEDETFCLDNFTNSGRKRVRKRNFKLVDKNEKSDDSATDEEIIDQ